jgi:hypothetical protein
MSPRPSSSRALHAPAPLPHCLRTCIKSAHQPSHLDFTQPACESCGYQTPTPRRIRTCFPRRRPVLTRSVFSRGATDRQIPSQNGTDRSQGAQNKVPRVRFCAEQPARDNTISLVTFRSESTATWTLCTINDKNVEAWAQTCLSTAA